MSEPKSRPRFRIYRAAEAVELTTDHMPLVDMSEEDAAGMGAAMAAGYAAGADTRVLFADTATGLSLTHARFRADLLLPRHSHDAHCAYYVLEGEAHLGSTILRKGDSFIVPKDDFYTYRAGPEGVEILEFRSQTDFHFRFGGNNAAFWSELVANTQTNGPRWQEEQAAEKKAAAPEAIEA